MLSNFYKDLQAWIDGGFPESPIFNRNRAMCVSYGYWLESKGHEANTSLLTQQFIDAKLDSIYPFNPKSNFWTELVSGTVWKNEARLQWVLEHART